MPPAARITDLTTHGAPLAPGPGSTDVLIGGMPAWRALMDQHACPLVNVSGADGVGMVMMGSPTVLIDYMMACRMGDIVVEVPGLAMGPMNPIVLGCPTVIIGEAGAPSPGAGGLGGIVAGLAAGGILNLIENASTFKTNGLDRNAADRYLSTPEGEQLLDELGRSDPKATPSQIYRRAVDLLSTGSNSPAVKDAPPQLVKIVPQGQQVSEYSPFFATPEELRSAAASGKSLSDYFGLPLKSTASTYDIYQITPKAPAKVFVSKVAPTSELGGAVRNSGGASQTLVPNRNAWSPPVHVGTIQG